MFSAIRRFFAPPEPRRFNQREPRKYSEEELAAFEQSMGIRLPMAYRDYLRDTGGGEGTTSRVSLLEEWSQPNGIADELPHDILRRPFPHQTAWNDMTLRKEELGWKSPYYDDLLIQGSMRIVNTGCEGYHLLVVSGPEAGNLWHDDRACNGQGIYPLVSPEGGRLSFAEYLTLPAPYPFSPPW